MKKHFFMPSLRLIMLTSTCTALALIGCERDQQLAGQVDSANPSAARKGTLQPDYLVFKDADAFFKTIDTLKGLSATELDQWEGTQHVVSLRHHYNQVVAEEAANHRQELSAQQANPKQLIQHSRSAAALAHPTMLVYDGPRGGVELDLADLRMAAVLNREGIVKIGPALYQFTRHLNKTLLEKADRADVEEIQELVQATETDKSRQLYVNQVKITEDPALLRKAKTTGVVASRMCDKFNNTSPAKYRLTAYEEAMEEIFTNWVCIRSHWEDRLDPRCGCYQRVEVCDAYAPISTRYFVLQLKIRTLERGFWGGWYDQATELQKSDGYFQITGTLGDPWESDKGTGFDPFALTKYDADNTGKGLKSTFYYTFLATKNPAYSSSAIRFHPSSNHKVTWVGGYGCECDIK